MRRITSILLAAMLLFSFVGCDSNNTSSGTSSHKHAYTKEEVLIEARCNQDGKVKCECECGNAILKDIGKLAEHKWQDATCVKAKTCVWCGLTEGELAEHSWEQATCTQPETCKACGLTKGVTRPHIFVNNKCTLCGIAYDDVFTAQAGVNIHDCSLSFGKLPYNIVFEDCYDGEKGVLSIQAIDHKFTADKYGYINLSVDLQGIFTGISDGYSINLCWEIYNSSGELVATGHRLIHEGSNAEFKITIVGAGSLSFKEADAFKLVLKPV